MANDPFYKRCCITHRMDCKIEWHHAIQYKRRQLNEKWAIVPLSEEVHKMADNHDIKEKILHVALNRATDDDLKKYSKAVNLIELRNNLNKIWGK